MTQQDRDDLSADILDGLLPRHEMDYHATAMADDYARIRSILLEADHAELAEPPADLWGSISGAVAIERDRPVVLKGVDTAAFDTAAFDTAAFDTAAFDTAAFDTAAFDTTAFDTAAFDTAAFDSTSAGTASALSNVVPISSRRRWKPIAAAAAVLALAGGIVAVADNLGDEPTKEIASGPVVLSAAQLNRLEGDAGEGSAKLVKVNGETHLVLTTAQMPAPPSGHFYELWLLHSDGSPPTSLGQMDGSAGAPKDLELVLPPGVDPATAPTVDISLQTEGSNHVHSGHSLFRGSLA